MEYRTIPTTLGRSKLEQAALLQVPLQLTLVEFGDGDGAEYLPTGLESALKRKVYEALPNMLDGSAESETWVELHAVLPFDAGGWWLREFIVRDIDGHAIFIGNLPESFKPIGSTGAIKDIAFELVFDILSPDSVTLKVDPSKVLATRKFVETHVAQELAKLDHKQSVQYATNGNIDLNGLAVQAGGDWAVALPDGARVLVKDQVTASQNGLYVVAAGAWVRAADADISAEVTPGLVVAVEQGATLADTRWQLVTDGAIVLGTTALTFQNVTKGFAPLSSPAFTDNPTAPTPPQFNNDPALATTEFVQRALGNRRQVAVVSAGMVLSITDAGNGYVWGGVGDAAVTLPAKSTAVPGATFLFHNTNSGTITVQAAAGDTIDVGPASVTSIVVEPYTSLEIVSVQASTPWGVIGASVLAKHSSQFRATLSSSGSQDLPSGLIRKWGMVSTAVSVSSSPVNVTFPLAFPNGCLHVKAGIGVQHSNYDQAPDYRSSRQEISVGLGTATGFEGQAFMDNNTGNTRIVQWEAIGY